MLSEGAAFIIRDILESGGTVEQRLGTRLGARQGVAWKTGTSFGFRDAWSVGVSDRYTIGVWVGRPDGTPNPGFFGANVAAPLLLDLFHALDTAAPAPRHPPVSVSRGEICWPLGLQAKGMDDSACLERRSAWLLNNTAPPTFADPLYQGNLRYSYYTNSSHTARVQPGCSGAESEGDNGADIQLVQAVRWPAMLEPWLSPEQRGTSHPPPWSAACGKQEQAGHVLSISGARNGMVLHRAADGSIPIVELRARGAGNSVFWLVNGKLVARTRAGESYRHRFSEAGEQALTALDKQGAYDYVTLFVR